MCGPIPYICVATLNVRQKTSTPDEISRVPLQDYVKKLSKMEIEAFTEWTAKNPVTQNAGERKLAITKNKPMKFCFIGDLICI